MKPLWILLVVVILALIGYFLFIDPEPATAPTDETAGIEESSTEELDPSAGAILITYGENGFSPAAVTVPVGTTISWVNGTDGRMWVASAEHPTHMRYDGTALQEHCADGTPASPDVFDQCAASGTFSFTFTKTGTWPYHNHADSSAQGAITVTNAPAVIDADVQLQ